MHTHQQCAHLIQSGKVLEAVNSLKQRIAISGKDSEAHHLLGVAYIMLKDYKLAEKHLLKCMKIHPMHLDAQYNLARLYTELNKLSKAKLNLNNVLKYRPDWLQAQFALGLVAVGLNEKELAITSFQKVVDQLPDNYEAWTNLGNLHSELEEFELAKQNYQQALNSNPDFESAALGLAKVMHSLNQHQQIIEQLPVYADRLKIAPLYITIAHAYGFLGDKKQSKHYAKLAIEIGDELGEAHKTYYDASTIESAVDLEPLVKLLSKEGLSEEAKINIHFAMSAGLDSCAEYQQAFKHLDMANSLRRKEFKYSTAESKKLMDMFKQAYSKQKLEAIDSDTGLGENLIFIVGMPRSGTSLVEQIISSHSSVYGAGELQFMRNLWKKMKAPSEAKFHTQLLNKGYEYLVNAGQTYLDYTDDLKGQKPVLTDKMPHNFLMIGAIATLLPKAKIVHCKRNPIANCLSIYKADFRISHSYAFNQKELAEYHNLYENLMDYWRLVLPGKFYEIKYENLTSNQEEETRKLIQYCGLDWEDACLDFHKNRRAVSTASAYQVRQKMHNKSVDLWKRYGDGLKPLLDNLHIPSEYQD